jgi:Zn-dependent protease with chaperone function
MIAALRRLEHLNSGILPDSIKAFGISSGKKASSIWSTHPLIEERIEALQKRMYSL